MRSRTARACAAFSASSTVWPSSVRISDSRRADAQFVVDHKNGCHELSVRLRCCHRRPPRRPGAAGANVENDNETCAPRAPRPSAASAAPASRRLAMRTARAVFVGDLLDHRQAQAGALALGGDVGLEGALEHLARRSRGRCRCTVRRTARSSPLFAARGLGGARAPGRRRCSATASSAFCTRLCITWRSCVRVAHDQRQPGAELAPAAGPAPAPGRTAPAPRPTSAFRSSGVSCAAGSRA